MLPWKRPQPVITKWPGTGPCKMNCKPLCSVQQILGVQLLCHINLLGSYLITKPRTSRLRSIKTDQYTATFSFIKNVMHGRKDTAERVTEYEWMCLGGNICYLYYWNDHSHSLIQVSSHAAYRSGALFVVCESLTAKRLLFLLSKRPNAIFNVQWYHEKSDFMVDLLCLHNMYNYTKLMKVI